MIVGIIVGLGLIFGFSIAFLIVANSLTMYSDVGKFQVNYSDLSEEPLLITVKEDQKKDLSHIR